MTLSTVAFSPTTEPVPSKLVAVCGYAGPPSSRLKLLVASLSQLQSLPKLWMQQRKPSTYLRMLACLFTSTVKPGSYTCSSALSVTDWCYWMERKYFCTSNTLV